jgi:TatA/E family protein of Tat protein translocase
MPFNIGPMELIVVLIIALIVVGPGKLPDVGSALGKSIREFRKAATDVKESTSLEPAKAPEPPAVAAAIAAPAAPAVAAPEPAAAPVPAPIPPAVAAAPAAPAVAAEAAPAAASPEAGAVPEGADAGVWPAELVPAAEDVADVVADETAAPPA